MTGVVHGCVVVGRGEVEDLAQRLLALRAEIDGMLAAIGCGPSHAGKSREPTQPKIAPFADDLTLIRGIDAALRDQISSLGFDTFAQIARWSKRDVIYVSEALGLDRRISWENWIEQAAILAFGGMTAFAGGRSRSERGTDWSAAMIAPRSSPPDTQIAAGKRPSVWAIQSVRAKDTSPIAVPSLHPFRGIPSVGYAIGGAPSPASRGSMALLAKLAACLLSLLLAAVLTVDRNASEGRAVAAAPAVSRAVVDTTCAGRRALEYNDPTRSLLKTEG